MKRSFTAALLEKITAELGATVLLDPETPDGGGYITFQNGKRLFFMSNQFGVINQLGAGAAVQSRSCATFLLKIFGYSVPEEQFFFKFEPSSSAGEPAPRSVDEILAAGWEYAQTLGLPAVVKPNLSKHKQMTTAISSAAEYRQAAMRIFNSGENILVQRRYQGNDYCIIVLDDQVVAAYQRLPSGLCPDCQAADVTAQVHPALRQLCVTICRDLGLRFVSIDLIMPHIDQPPADYIILQINREPDLAVFAALGPEQTRTVEALYRTILLIAEQQI